MRNFNKLFVISLPRCATVSVAKAVGTLGIPVAHLGRIIGDVQPESEGNEQHFELSKLQRMLQQIEGGDFQLDLLRDCRGLADYPACCPNVLSRLDRQFPGSLFINVRRDGSVDRWLQSVEIQFVGSELLAMQAGQNSDLRSLVKLMRCFRSWTFGCESFDAQEYRAAYDRYQAWVSDYFGDRSQLLDFSGTELLKTRGFSRICEFLQIETVPKMDFPLSNQHSQAPKQAFFHALSRGAIRSTSGVSF